jgi:rhamnulokinase
MTSTLLPPTFDDNESPMSCLLKLSHYYGANPDYVLAGGGNSSCKTENLLQVKASGSTLANITEEGFVELNRAGLRSVLDCETNSDVTLREQRFKYAILAARLYPDKGQRPSVECALHNLLPSRFVMHTHPTIVNTVTCSEKGEELTRHLFGEELLWIPYVDPGLVLAQRLDNELKQYTAQTGNALPPAILMGNHGLIICGDTPVEILEHTKRVVDTIRFYLEERQSENAFGELIQWPGELSRQLRHFLTPLLKTQLSADDNPKAVAFDASPEALVLVASATGKEMAAGGPLTPDQIVYCKSFPLWFELQPGDSPEQLENRLSKAIEQYTAEWQYKPVVVLVSGLGIFTSGDSMTSANTARDVYLDAVKVMTGALQLGDIRHMARNEYQFIEHWEAESYRRKLAQNSDSQ